MLSLKSLNQFKNQRKRPTHVYHNVSRWNHCNKRYYFACNETNKKRKMKVNTRIDLRRLGYIFLISIFAIIASQWALFTDTRFDCWLPLILFFVIQRFTVKSNTRRNVEQNIPCLSDNLLFGSCVCFGRKNENKYFAVLSENKHLS